MNLNVITFGCRLNSYESEVIKDMLSNSDLNASFGDKELLIFNSCAVTKEAERQLRQAIRKAKNERGDNVVIGVVGCAAQINGATYINMPEVDFIMGNYDKLKVDNYKNIQNNRIIVSDVFSTDSRKLDNYLLKKYSQGRAFVRIQNGCDNQCTFCVTRLARGKSISVSPKQILDQIKILIDKNYKEIVLTGINITSYGKDFCEKTSLNDLIIKILDETGVARLRLSSLDISDINNDFIDIMKYEIRLMPHIHISIQSGDNIILKRMKRRHTREEVIEKCTKILQNRPNIVFGADFIAGFPTETDKMHNNSLNLIEQIPITFGHVFPYSERPGTEAAKMPQVDKNTRKIRAKELRLAADNNLNILKNKMSGTRQKIFVEAAHCGRLENYLQVNLVEDFTKKIGEILEIEI